MEERSIYVPADTTLEAARVHSEIYRRMSPARRLELVLEMSESFRRVMAEGVKSRHPDYTPEQVRLAVIRLSLGDELFAQVYPGVQVAV
jgi:hypothetical protein